jgi:hypothetical protein
MRVELDEIAQKMYIHKIKREIKVTKEYIQEREASIEGLKEDIVLYETELVRLGLKI